MNQDPEFTYDEDLHEYRYKGLVLPHPTGLLQEFGLIDYSRVPEERLNYKRSLGLAVDKACELHDLGRLDENTVHPEIAPYVLAWIKFCQVEKFKPEHNQLPLLSKKHLFAGRLDKLGEFRGKMAVLDIKCTWSMYASTGPQLAAYKMLVKENLKIKAPDRYGILLKPTGNYEVTQFKDSLDEDLFLSCLQLHYWKQKNGGTQNGNGDTRDE